MRTKRFVAFTLIICMVTLLNGNAFAATTDTPRNSQRIDDQVELPQVVKGNDIFS